ncbi:MAG TPA: 6,7-dimethyl-8-ribityllumazine synthase [Rubricoccaceae bacterium]|jgi:6,7-dimethyl-8-ribityllumazine synthase
MTTVFEGSLVSPAGARYAVVAARFNDAITRRLLDGALDAFARHGAPADAVDVAWVPGAFEIPAVAQRLAASGRYGAVVCLGAVIRGATGHYDIVANGVASGCQTAALTTGVPVLLGVLTVDTLEQAWERAGTKAGNKGAEAAASAVELVNLSTRLDAADREAAAPSGDGSARSPRAAGLSAA